MTLKLQLCFHLLQSHTFWIQHLVWEPFLSKLPGLSYSILQIISRMINYGLQAKSSQLPISWVLFLPAHKSHFYFFKGWKNNQKKLILWQNIRSIISDIHISVSICCFICPDVVHRILRQPPIFPLPSIYMPCEISPPLKRGFEEENLKTCPQLETTSCWLCFCNSVSCLQSQVKLHSLGGGSGEVQKFTTMLGAETYLTHPCQLPSPWNVA